jgi:hypothetical protein
MARGRWGSAGLAALVLVQAACFLEIREVRDPGPAFEEARAQAERDQRRPGKASRINVLVFDPEESRLVRVSLPIWLASKIEGNVRQGKKPATPWSAAWARAWPGGSASRTWPRRGGD